MRTVIIGTGNVAHVLGRKFLAADHEVVQVFGRNEATAKELGSLLHCSWTAHFSSVNKTADLYVIAVTDTAIPAVAAELNPGRKLVVHTAGSVSKEVLKTCSNNYGILWPVQSLRKEMYTLPEIPFIIDGNTADDLTLIGDFAKTLSVQVQAAGDEQRLKFHIAAVVVSNFTNHLYALAEEYCKKERIDFRIMLPLITAIADRLQQFSPRDVQTGPGVRGDEVTVRKHLDLLKEHPALEKFYELFTKSIGDMYR